MGIFDKIGEVIGDVVDGVVDFVDDVFGIDFKKILDNDIVRYGLMAASIFTGGVAIANGVMTGFKAASAAKSFMGKFVDGAAGFVQGVASGFMNPVSTAKDLGQQASNAVFGDPTAAISQTTGQPSSASQIVDSLSDTGDIVEIGKGGQGLTPDDILSGGAPQEQFVTPLSEMSQVNQQAVQGAQQAASQPVAGMDTGGAAPNLRGPGPAATPGASPTPAPGTGGVPTNVSNAAPNKSIWQKIADGATDFATSPAGMQTLAGMASGWAQGEAQQEMWDNRIQEDRRRESSWADGQWAPRAAGRIPSLQQLRQQQQERSDAAMRKFGY